ncbi:hypothetical protein LZ554_001433 [Drepanopeziza brunnea f. sp. 'monogermtubi']|nr:hypothetical protein LZ554_001433 [Drepanopeziza brunnea f. sp. 'monogermtubi']
MEDAKVRLVIRIPTGRVVLGGASKADPIAEFGNVEFPSLESVCEEEPHLADPKRKKKLKQSIADAQNILDSCSVVHVRLAGTGLLLIATESGMALESLST